MKNLIAHPMSVFQVWFVGNVKSETTLNYQVGSVYHGKNWRLSLDEITPISPIISFSNRLVSRALARPRRM